MLRQLDVQSPQWLDTVAMQYRLAYADRARREVYAGSRWVALDAAARKFGEEIENWLKHAGNEATTIPDRCRLG